MIPRLTQPEYVDGNKIKVAFADGKCATIDLEDELWDEVFEPLKALAQFRKFVRDPDLATIVWPSGADPAPEYLHRHIAA